jgi:phosphatidylglycerol:prolipoprotein diacylglycerol transferase
MQPLDPIAIQLGPISVYWYGIIMGSAVFLGLLLATREAKKQGLNPDIFVDLILWGVPFSIIGARTYYVILEWDHYGKNPGDIIAVWEGGLAIHGALIAATLTGIVFARVKKISFWQLADIAAPSLILGQAIGRWGNFMNQEAHGGPVSEAFISMFPQFIQTQMFIDGQFYHPTFLYESLWNLLVLAILLVLRRQNWIKRGEVFLSYLMMYSVGRFFIEGMRTDSLMLTDTIRMAQFISILIIIGAALLIFWRRKQTGINGSINSEPRTNQTRKNDKALRTKKKKR